MYLHSSLSNCFGFQVKFAILSSLTSIFYFFTCNNICACQAPRRPILAFKDDLEIFDEVLKPLLDVELVKLLLDLSSTLMTIFPSRKEPKLISIVSKSDRIPLLRQF
jgi:hypothetical protein